MNLTKAPTRQQLRALMFAVDDGSDHHVVWVGHDGEVHIEAMQGRTPASWEEQNEARIRFRLESYQRGNGYLGPDAAKDDQWVGRVFEQLTKAWADGRTEMVDW